jgi:predicted alpha/beta-hydrolase family hydrolase
VELLRTGPAGAPRRLLLAHGAGAPMDTPFMNGIAERLGAAGVEVLRFEFPYMAARRVDGKRRGPDRAPVLLEAFRKAVAAAGEPARLFVGGKSMGGRMASLLADELCVPGLICLGYPFHPPAKPGPGRQRLEHLATLRTPTLIVQGTRDEFGGRQEVSGYALSPAIDLRWLEDGDHSFEPRKKSGRTHAQALDEAAQACIDFMERLAPGPAAAPARGPHRPPRV